MVIMVGTFIYNMPNRETIYMKKKVNIRKRKAKNKKVNIGNESIIINI